MMQLNSKGETAMETNTMLEQEQSASNTRNGIALLKLQSCWKGSKGYRQSNCK